MNLERLMVVLFLAIGISACGRQDDTKEENTSFGSSIVASEKAIEAIGVVKWQIDINPQEQTTYGIGPIGEVVVEIRESQQDGISYSLWESSPEGGLENSEWLLLLPTGELVDQSAGGMKSFISTQQLLTEDVKQTNEGKADTLTALRESKFCEKIYRENKGKLLATTAVITGGGAWACTACGVSLASVAFPEAISSIAGVCTGLVSCNLCATAVSVDLYIVFGAFICV